MSAHADGRPVIALAMGDPAGVSPELTAKLVALPEARAAARLVVIGDKRVFDAGAAVAGVAVDVDVVGPADPLQASGRCSSISATSIRRPSPAASRRAQAASRRSPTIGTR